MGRKQSGDDDLERTPEGFYRTRLRYGKGLRARFLIKLTDEEAAKRRQKRLRELAEMLADAGHSAEAYIILKKAAAVSNDRDFADAVKFAEALCAETDTNRKRKKTTTFKDLGEQWTKGELHDKWPDHVKLKRSADHDKGRLEWLYERIGTIPLAAFTLEDAERAMADLDSELSSATRRQYAQLISKVLKLAVYPCKVIDRSPLPVGFLPKVKSRKATAWLYPSEDAALMSCVPTAEKPGVPLARRVLYGFLAREGLRIGEATSLQWRDFDLVRGVVTLDKNKTDDPRAWVLSPGVKEALDAFRLDDASADALVFPPEDRAAETFREDLQAAEVARPELFEDNDTRKQIRAHDLRSTFVTLSLACEKSESWVADRTGHKSSIMINRYRRAARTAAELALGPLASMVDAIPEIKERHLARKGGPEGGPTAEKIAQKPVIEEETIEPNLPVVAPPRLELGRPLGRGILSPLRLPFRQGATRVV
jgi:integrase